MPYDTNVKSPSIGGDRLIYLTIETKLKPHTAGTISNYSETVYL
jgi:hypothetical protein